MEDYTQGDWEPKLRTLLDFAVQITRDPHAGGAAAVQALRDADWGDEAILEAVEIIGFFNYYNRLVDALGVEDEPEWDEANRRE
jgi:alkylhydroperoxidase family enzyme